MRRGVAALALLQACAGVPEPCELADCDCDAGVEEPTAVTSVPPLSVDGYTPSAFEVDALSETVEDIRLGIRAWDDNSVGICLGTHTCEGFLGPAPGVLPQGDYVLQAILNVPNAGTTDTWTLHSRTQCAVTTWEGEVIETRIDLHERDFSVSYAGQNRGYPLRPLAVIRSPLTDASMDCTWTLESTHPGTPSSWSGGWQVPRAETP